MQVTEVNWMLMGSSKDSLLCSSVSSLWCRLSPAWITSSTWSIPGCRLSVKITIRKSGNLGEPRQIFRLHPEKLKLYTESIVKNLLIPICSAQELMSSNVFVSQQDYTNTTGGIITILSGRMCSKCWCGIQKFFDPFFNIVKVHFRELLRIILRA